MPERPGALGAGGEAGEGELEETVGEGFGELGVAHEEAEVERAVDEVEGEFEVEAGAELALRGGQREKASAFLTGGHDEVIAEGFGEFGFALRGGEESGGGAAGGGGEGLREFAEVGGEVGERGACRLG